MVIVMHKLFKPLAAARPTAHPRIMEAVDPHFEGVKPLFDEVSVGIVDPTAQPSSSKSGPIAELINEKLSIREIVFLTEPVQKRSRRIGAMPTKQHDIKNQLCLSIYCSVQPRPLTINFDSSLIDCDPLRLRLRRVVSAVSQPMNPVPDRSIRAFNASFSENRCCLTERTTSLMETDSKRPHGRPQNSPSSGVRTRRSASRQRCRPLVLPSFFKISVIALTEQVCEHLWTRNSTTCSLLKLTPLDSAR